MKILLIALVFFGVAAPALAQQRIELQPLTTLEWDPGHEGAHFTYGDVDMVLEFTRPEPDANWVESVKLIVTGNEGEDFTLNSEAGLNGFGQIGIYPIDRQGGMSIVFGAYTGGAHCCMSLYAARLLPEGTQVTELGYYDGGIVALTDIDGDGLFELNTVDQRFNYTFDSYASSFAPIAAIATDAGIERDVIKQAGFKSALKSDMRHQSRFCGGAEGWHASACAALAANAARIGRYDTVRAMISEHLQTADFDSGWDEFSFCDDDACNTRTEFDSFLEALDFALEKWGYL